MSPAEESREEKLRHLRERLDGLNRSFVKKQPDAFGPQEVRAALKRRAQASQGVPAAPPASEPEPLAPILLRRDRPQASRASRAVAPARRPQASVSLEDAVEGDVVTRPDGRTYLAVTTDVDNVEGRESLGAKLAAALTGELPGLSTRLAVECNGSVAPEQIVFMDIETTGLNNVPLFLIGVMRFEGSRLRVRQYLARTYAEEAPVIAAFGDEITGQRTLVTFNGKSFDVPYVRTRAVATGVKFACNTGHVNLLHEARRAWRHELPDCKLQTLETMVCGHAQRFGDIPGAEIGDAYHAFVRSGNAWQIVQILKHNMLDLVTLAEILLALPAPSRP